MLNGVRVLDLCDERGYVAGWMLAELGAEVVAIEPKGGSPARRLGPFAGGEGDQGKANASLCWWAYARNKRSAVVDLDSEDGRDQLRELVKRADVLIESRPPGELASMGLGFEQLAELNPALVYTSITPFGQDGPKAGWAATDLTVLAAGGPLWLSGDNDRAPVRVAVPQAFAHAGAEGATATLVALHERQRSGRGQHVDVSAQQAVTLATQSDIVSAAVGDVGARRYGGGIDLGAFIVRLVYPALDGHVSITHVFGGAIGPGTVRLMERVYADGFCDEAMRDKNWIGYGGLLLKGTETAEDFNEAKACVAAWTSSMTKEQLLDQAMEHGLLVAPCSSTKDVSLSKQLAARGVFVDQERPDGAGQARLPGRFAHFSGVAYKTPKPAPNVGQHTDEVLQEWGAAPPVRLAVAAEPTARPLEGMKVLDFMWAIAGPMSTRILADYGATVIRVESLTHIDALRTMRPYLNGKPNVDQAALFHACNASKLMLSLDLSNPEARPVIEDLVGWADIVCESFAPGKLESMGWGYQSLREMKPDLIMLSTSLMGQTGPLAKYAGYGNLAAAVSGFFELTGWDDRAPAGPFGAYTDYIVPKFCASSLLAAVEHRRRTGEGQHIDVSQAEAALSFIAPALFDYEINGVTATRSGNRDLHFAPHGVYPCSGDDSWIAIGVETDVQWEALCGALNADDLAGDARFSNTSRRRENAQLLDDVLSQLTSAFAVDTLETTLQAGAVPAHAVLDSVGLCADPQLLAREHFLSRGDEGAVVESVRTKLLRTPAVVRDGLPLIGRDNHHVLTEVLGYGDDRVTELVIAGALD